MTESNIKKLLHINKDFSEADLIQKSISANRIILRAAVLFEVIVELILMFRVIFMSNSGLATLNNRIYFGFYLIYFLLGFLFLLLDFLAELSDKTRYNMYLLSGSVMMLWHTLFNIYDIYHSNAAGEFTIITAMVIFCFLFVMKPLYALINISLSYILFAVFLGKNFSSGEVINFSITVLLCVLIYFVRYKHLCVELSQDKLIGDIRQTLSETQRNFYLSVEQYKMICDMGDYMTFEWDVIRDRLILSDDYKSRFGVSNDIPNFYSVIIKSNRLTKDQKENLQQIMDGIRNGIPFQHVELMLTMKNGKNGWFDIRVITQLNENGKPSHGIGILSDITEQKETILQLEREIQMDLFTGLLNKTAIEHYGTKKLQNLQKGKILAMLILDMDNFKSINDSFGHPVGDYVLKKVADIMHQKAPVKARVGHIGGDEFAVLLLTDDLSVIKKFAIELIEDISNIRYNGTDVGVSCTIGISAADSDKWTFPMLYKAADDALYKAKSKGKNQIVCEGEYCNVGE